jgi:hypothetical protein
MLQRRTMRLISLALASLFLLNNSAFSKASHHFITQQAPATLEEVTKSANRAVVEAIGKLLNRISGRL